MAFYLHILCLVVWVLCASPVKNELMAKDEATTADVVPCYNQGEYFTIDVRKLASEFE